MADWTPGEITTALWLDASDSSSITESSGSVSQWNDKSGNNRHVSQGTSSNQPAVTSSEINSLDVVTFDGTNDSLTTSSQPITGTSARSIFAVVRAHTYGTALNAYLCLSDDTTTADPGTLWNQTVEDDGLWIRVRGSAQWTPIVSTNDTFLHSVVWASGEVDDSDLWLDGSAMTLSAATSFTIDTETGNLCVGGQMNGTDNYFFDGDIAEIIIIADAVSTDTRQKIEGYLAHKWGLESSLPSDHPYKTSAPLLSTIDAAADILVTPSLVLSVGEIQATGSISTGADFRSIVVGLIEAITGFDSDTTSFFITEESVVRYLMDITGGPDGTTDVTIPISSFQARRRSGEDTFVQVVIPTYDYVDEITARSNGHMLVKQAYERDGEYQQVETIIDTTIDDIRYDRGGQKQSMTLTGYSTTTYPPKTVSISNVVYAGFSGGKTRYRLASPNIFLNPGDTVEIADDGTTFEIDTISYAISPAISMISVESV